MIKEGLGLNLFSIRNYLDTEEHFLEAAKALKEMGYSYIQFSGAPFDPQMIKRVIDATGLKVVLTHVPMDRILNDTEALMDEHASIGCYNIGLGMMPIDAMKDEALCRETIDKLNEAGAKYFLVEQDNAAILPDTLGQVERSVKYVAANLG